MESKNWPNTYVEDFITCGWERVANCRKPIIAAVAAYLRVVAVRITLVNDWIGFIPALLLGNFVYFISLYFSNYSIDYFHLFTNSIFTFIFYPILWVIFLLILNLTKS